VAGRGRSKQKDWQCAFVRSLLACSLPVPFRSVILLTSGASSDNNLASPLIPIISSVYWLLL